MFALGKSVDCDVFKESWESLRPLGFATPCQGSRG